MKRTFLALAAAVLPALAGAQTVTVKGSDTMVILAQRWAENYMKANPSKRVQVTGGGENSGNLVNALLATMLRKNKTAAQ